MTTTHSATTYYKCHGPYRTSDIVFGVYLPREPSVFFSKIQQKWCVVVIRTSFASLFGFPTRKAAQAFMQGYKTEPSEDKNE